MQENKNNSENGQNSIPAVVEKLTSEEIFEAVSSGKITVAEGDRMFKECYGVMERGVNPQTDETVPKQTTEENRVNRFARTSLESGKMNPEAMEEVKRKIATGELAHMPISDQAVREYAKEITQTAGYRRADDHTKAEMIQMVYSYADGLAKQTVSDYELTGTNATIQKFVNAGVETVDAIYAMVMTNSIHGADLDGNGYLNKKEYAESLKRSELDNETSRIIYNTRYAKKKK